MRTYSNEVEDLASLKHNPPSDTIVSDFYDLPEGKQADRVFNISVSANTVGEVTTLNYTVNGNSLDYLVLRAAAGDWIEVNLSNELSESDVINLGTQWPAASLSSYASSNAVEGFSGSYEIGLNPRLLDYDSGKAAGLNIGLNGQNGGSQTVAIGEQKSYLWYAGSIELGDNGERVLTPVEFGGVNLTPSDLLLQSSYGLSGMLVVEPQGATWDAADDHKPSAVINAPARSFTEVIVAGTKTAVRPRAKAGTEVRFRVVNPNIQAAGTVGDSVNVLWIEGHNWPEEPYVDRSSVIADNRISQTMGSQQVTALEGYNMVIESAGGDAKKAGEYDFYYYPKGPPAILGTLIVTEQ
jgi:hypothetical protein